MPVAQKQFLYLARSRQENFNSKTNYFTTEFAERFAPINPNLGKLLGSKDGRKLADTINDGQGKGFKGILKFFSKASSNQDPGYWTRVEDSLLGYLNPWSGTPESINSTIRLMQTVSNKIQSIIGVVRTQQRQQVNINETTQIFLGGPDGTKEHIAAKNRTFKITTKPCAIFNANLPHNLGFDFLGTTWPRPSTTLIRNGLSVVPYSDFEDRIFDQYNIPGDIPSGQDSGVFHGTTIPAEAIITKNVAIRPQAAGDQWGSYFCPYAINIPSQEAAFQIPDTYGSSDFLKPVSFSLYGKITDTLFLSRLESGIAARTSTHMAPQDKIFANDLSAYFSSYHSAQVVAPDVDPPYNEVFTRLHNTYVRSSLASTRADEGFGDMYYKSLRRETNADRDDAYLLLFKTLNSGIYDSQHKRNLDLVDPINYREFDYTRPTSILSRNLLSAFNTAQTQAGGSLNKAEWYSVYLEKAPPQIKFLLFQNPIFNGLRIRPSTKSFYQNVDSAVTTYPEFIYRTQYINRAEYLSEYEVGTIKLPYDPRETQDTLSSRNLGSINNEKQVVLMKSPKWTPTFKRINDPATAGYNYLCRILPYTNKTLMIRRDKTYDLPTYDEHFYV